MDERMIAKCNTNGYREYRIPGILSVKDGFLLAFEGRVDDLNDWGDIDIIIMKLEPDGTLHEILKIGESHLPADGTMRTYSNPVLVPDGERVHLIYHRNYEQAFVVTSENGGRSWSEAREITDVYRRFPYEWNVCATGPGHGIQTGRGRLIAPVWLVNGELYEDGMRRRHWPSVAGCVYSDDHGLTWQAGGVADFMKDANETSVAELEDGGLLFNYRNRNVDRHRVLAVSEDGGESLGERWTSAELRDPMCFGGMTVNGREVLFVNCDTETKRTDLAVKRSMDRGKNWEKIWEVDSVGGYADIAVVNGEIYVFYERQSYEENIVKELVLKNRKESWNRDEEGI